MFLRITQPLPVVLRVHLDNPRKEKEAHYYNPKHHGLLELGLQPHYLTDEVVAQLLEQVRPYRDRIDAGKILPRVTWR